MISNSSKIHKLRRKQRIESRPTNEQGLGRHNIPVRKVIKDMDPDREDGVEAEVKIGRKGGIDHDQEKIDADIKSIGIGLPLVLHLDRYHLPGVVRIPETGKRRNPNNKRA